MILLHHSTANDQGQATKTTQLTIDFQGVYCYAVNMKTNLPVHFFILLTSISIIFSGCSYQGFKPKETGILNDRLRDCPPAPKCVSSYYTDGIHHIEPLRYTGSKQDAFDAVIETINVLKRSQVVAATPNYIHAQFKVTVFDWIDDTEFLFDKDKKIIHYSSSASAPFGWWDWGKNRKRALLIKTLFNDIIATKKETNDR